MLKKTTLQSIFTLCLLYPVCIAILAVLAVAAYLGFEYPRPTGMPSRRTMPISLVHLKTLDGSKKKRKSKLD